MKNQNKLKATILSLSLITVMAGAAVSPALGSISTYFSDVNPMLIKMILTVPGLFILVLNLCFPAISQRLNTRTIAIIGLLLYTIGGTSGAFATNIYTLLRSRALVGMGVGLIMPLSTGLLAYYFQPQEQKKLMGYSVAMNNLGGIIAMALSGVLSSISWNYSFYVYLTGVLVVILVLAFLPKVNIGKEGAKLEGSHIKDKFVYIAIMFLLNISFYLYIVNFSIVTCSEGIATAENVGVLMSTQSVGALIMALFFGKFSKILGKNIKIFGISLFLIAYMMLYSLYNYYLYAFALVLCGMGFGTLMAWVNSKAIEGLKREQAPSIMAFVSMGMYLGQFLAPILSSLLASNLGITSLRFPYILAITVIIITFIMLCLEGRSQNEMYQEAKYFFRR